jgi:hypothetical protein
MRRILQEPLVGQRLRVRLAARGGGRDGVGVDSVCRALQMAASTASSGRWGLDRVSQR